MDKMNVFFMKKACKLAEKSVEKKGGPFGCVIVDKDDYIIAEGDNCVTENNDPTAHAEMVTLRKACSVLNNYNLKGCKLYSSSEPCSMCLSAIYWARIDKVYYGNSVQEAKEIGFDDDFIYEEIKKKKEERKIEMKRIEIEESSNAFNEWKKKESKKEY